MNKKNISEKLLIDMNPDEKFNHYLDAVEELYFEVKGNIRSGDESTRQFASEVAPIVKQAYRIIGMKKGKKSQEISNTLAMLRRKAKSFERTNGSLSRFANEYAEAIYPIITFLDSNWTQGLSENKKTNNNTIMEIKARDLKNFLGGKSNLVVETTTVGAIKNQISEMRNKAMLGLGFKKDVEETKSALDNNEIGQQVKSKIEEEEDTPYTKKTTKAKAPASSKNFDFSRKVNNKGSMMLGQGFKITESMLKKLNLTTEGLVDLVETVVNELKGNNEYTNLRFVDTIGSKYHMNESTITDMKKIIRSENSIKTGRKLFNYIVECACDQAQDSMSQHKGLNPKQDASSMINEIKKNFNENRKKMSANEAVGMTAESVGVPAEMVQEMYEALKESAKMKTESGMSSNGINETLNGIYERYQGMGEGDVYGMYDEMAEMMEYPSSEEFELEGLYGSPIDESEDEFDPAYGDSNFTKFQKMDANTNRAGHYEPDYDYDYDYDFEDEAPIVAEPKAKPVVSPEAMLQRQMGEAESEDVKNLGSDEEELSYDDLIGAESEEDIEQRADFQMDDFMDSQHEGSEMFDEVFNEMEGFMQETMGDETNVQAEVIATNPKTGELEEYEIMKRGHGYMVNGDSPESDVRVYVKNGEVVNGEYLPMEVTKAILKLHMGEQPMSEMDMMESVSEEEFLEETKSALDNLEVGQQAMSSNDEMKR